VRSNNLKFVIKPITKVDREWIVSYLSDNWGSDFVISRGQVQYYKDLDGYVCKQDDRYIGLITVNYQNDACEIVTLNSLVQQMGIGSALLSRVISEAKSRKCNRLWLITTNDNTHAQKFYKKHGFKVKKIHKNTFQKYRQVKPEIPMIGFDNIPITDEIEFEILFKI
jgi:GNAT superfamily N-acetyltransferase